MMCRFMQMVTMFSIWYQIYMYSGLPQWICPLRWCYVYGLWYIFFRFFKLFGCIWLLWYISQAFQLSILIRNPLHRDGRINQCDNPDWYFYSYFSCLDKFIMVYVVLWIFLTLLVEFKILKEYANDVYIPFYFLT